MSETCPKCVELERKLAAARAVADDLDARSEAMRQRWVADRRDRDFGCHDGYADSARRVRAALRETVE